MRRRTGGNLYDARIVRALRAAGLAIRVVSVGGAADVRAATRDTPLVIVDSIAFAHAARALPASARVIALAHMRVRGRAARAMLRRADVAVAVSRPLARELRALGAGDVRVIPPGCDGVPRGRRRRHSGGPLRVLAVANWSRVKGTDTLLRAIARVPDVALTSAGDHVGPFADALRPRVSALGSRLRTLGSVGARRLSRAYADADVVVLPSRTEGYSIASAEALFHGLPVVASDIPGLRAPLGAAARYVRPSDVRALARALDDMRDARRRRGLARAARARGEALPRWKDTERALVSLVDEELQRRRSGGDGMPPRGVKSPKRKRQYEKIKKSVKSRGRSEKTAERIAAATTNKTRRRKGETKGSRKKS